MKYFSKFMENDSVIKDVQMILKNTSMVDITHLFEQQFIQELTEDTLDVYNEKMQRKDFLMQQTNNTPRNMYSVPEYAIEEKSRLIPIFYNDPKVAQFLSVLAQEEVMVLPWSGEKYVINGLSQANDTHGWHWDDYSYALVFIAKAPTFGEGGEVECVPNTYWDRKNPRINEILKEHQHYSYHFKDGSFYLMKSDTTLHRVTPIKNGSIRIAIAMSWCARADLTKDINHETVYNLYGVKDREDILT